jgi:hypothetical protein
VLINNSISLVHDFYSVFIYSQHRVSNKASSRTFSIFTLLFELLILKQERCINRGLNSFKLTAMAMNDENALGSIDTLFQDTILEFVSKGE